MKRISIKYTLALFITLMLVSCNNGNNTNNIASSNKKSSEDIQNLDKGLVLKKIYERRIYENIGFDTDSCGDAHYVEVECNVNWPVLIDGNCPKDLQKKKINALFHAESGIAPEKAINDYMALPDSLFIQPDFFDINKAKLIDSIPKEKFDYDNYYYFVVGDVYNYKDGKYVVYDCFYKSKVGGFGAHLPHGDIFLIYDIEQERVVSLDDLILPNKKRELYTMVEQGLKRDYPSEFDSLSWDSNYNPDNLIDNLLIDIDGNLCMSYPPLFIGDDPVVDNMHVGLPTANIAPILTDTGKRLLSLK